MAGSFEDWEKARGGGDKMRKKRQNIKMKKMLVILEIIFYIILNVMLCKAFIYGIDTELDYNLHNTQVHLEGVRDDLKNIENFRK